MTSDDTASWFAAARAALPEIDVPEAEFRRVVEQRLAAAEPARIQHAADLYLACGCALGLPAALRRFEDEHIARIGAWIGAAARDPRIVDEVRQLVRTRVLVGAAARPPRIADYSGVGPLGAWVRVIAVREHVSLHRDAHADAGGADDALEAMARTGEVSPELAALRARYQPLLSAAFRAAITDLPARDRTLLRLAYVDALSLEAIGRLYSVNRSTVSRWLASARAIVLAAALAHVRAELGASSDDAESLLGLVRSNLEISLQGLLAAG